MFENKNMKKIVIYLSLTVIICFGIGFLIFNNTGGFNGAYGDLSYSQDSKQYTFNDEKSGNIDGISEVSVQSTSAQVNIIPEKRADVKVHMYGNISANYEPELSLNVRGGNMEISTDKHQSGSFSINNSDLKLDIFIPENYIKNLNVKTTSGNIRLINKIKLQDVSLNSTSGDLNLKDLSCENFEGNSTSGEISGNNIIVTAADINSVSGALNFSEFQGGLKGETTSGEINIDYSDFDINTELKSVSGDIKLKLPGSAQFKIKSKTVSGDISCKFPVTLQNNEKRNELNGIVGSDLNKITLNTVSGDAVIDKK